MCRVGPLLERILTASCDIGHIKTGHPSIYLRQLNGLVVNTRRGFADLHYLGCSRVRVDVHGEFGTGLRCVLSP